MPQILASVTWEDCLALGIVLVALLAVVAMLRKGGRK